VGFKIGIASESRVTDHVWDLAELLHYRRMSMLLKSGIWVFVLSVVVFSLMQNGVSGPTTELQTYLAEVAMFGAPIGIGICISAGGRALLQRKAD